MHMMLIRERWDCEWSSYLHMLVVAMHTQATFTGFFSVTH